MRAPQFQTIRDVLDFPNGNITQLIKAWADAQHVNFGLGYKPPIVYALAQTHRGRGYQPLTEEEVDLLDAAMLRLKREFLNAFNAIKLRYIYRLTLREVAAALGKGSPRMASYELDKAEVKFDRLLRVVFLEEQGEDYMCYAASEETLKGHKRV